MFDMMSKLKQSFAYVSKRIWKNNGVPDIDAVPSPPRP